MLKSLQARPQVYVNHELPDVQGGFRKGRGTRDQIANICWIIEKESSRKTSTFALFTMPKPLTMWITINCGIFFKKIRYTKGTFYAKMGTIKDRNSMDLTEAEDIKNRQEYTEELY